MKAVQFTHLPCGCPTLLPKNWKHAVCKLHGLTMTQENTPPIKRKKRT